LVADVEPDAAGAEWVELVDDDDDPQPANARTAAMAASSAYGCWARTTRTCRRDEEKRTHERVAAALGIRRRSSNLHQRFTCPNQVRPDLLGPPPIGGLCT
jgi:hypothetical protein